MSDSWCGKELGGWVKKILSVADVQQYCIYLSEKVPNHADVIDGWSLNPKMIHKYLNLLGLNIHRNDK